MGDGDYNSDHHSWMLVDEDPRGCTVTLLEEPAAEATVEAMAKAMVEATQKTPKARRSN